MNDYVCQYPDCDCMSLCRTTGREVGRPRNRKETHMTTSVERHERRLLIAEKFARERYASDDLEIDGEEANADVESVDGGYWVQARVWVPAEDVEAWLKRWNDAG